jgi:phosphoribosylformimino-5-aminoimidazole carboxamide ribotide isomerase
MITGLESWCAAFLYTHIDTEGLMQGIPMDVVRQLRDATSKQLIAAGGIATNHQIDELDALHIDAVVGMAIYTGRIKLLSPTRRPSLAAGPQLDDSKYRKLY